MQATTIVERQCGLKLLRVALWDSFMLFLMCYPETGYIRTGEAKLVEPPDIGISSVL
jgi:hypothetical protein